MKHFFQIVVAVLLVTQAQAGLTLTEFWNGGGVWVKDADDIGSDFGFHFISIIPGRRELTAYYIDNHRGTDRKSKSAIGRARGTDGVHWTNDGRVLEVSGEEQGTNRGARLWDDRLTSFPGAWKDGDTWYLVYEGASEDIAFSPGDIGLATSRDGKVFVKHPQNPILRHNPDGWERVNIGTPSLYKEKGIWYLFYHGFDGNVCQIGVASGTSLTNLTKSPANPIIPVTPGSAGWDTGTIGRRSAIAKEGPYYFLSFEGSTQQPYELARWSSGLARSTNLIANWTKYPGGPLVPQTPGGMGNDGPELLRLSNIWYLYARLPTGNKTGRYRLEVSAP